MGLFTMNRWWQVHLRNCVTELLRAVIRDLERAADEQGRSPLTLLEQAMAAALAAGLVSGAPVPNGLRTSRT